MEEETYTFGDYFNQVKARIDNLSDREMSALAKLQASPQGELLGKILGEDIIMLRDSVTSKPKRGLAARK